MIRPTPADTPARASSDASSPNTTSVKSIDANQATNASGKTRNGNPTSRNASSAARTVATSIANHPPEIQS